jgi:hypothetical protein
MRNAPLILHVAWGRNQRGSAPLDTLRGGESPFEPPGNSGAHYFRNCLISGNEDPPAQKKIKPRGNGALKDEKR